MENGVSDDALIGGGKKPKLDELEQNLKEAKDAVKVRNAWVKSAKVEVDSKQTRVNSAQARVNSRQAEVDSWIKQERALQERLNELLTKTGPKEQLEGQQRSTSESFARAISERDKAANLVREAIMERDKAIIERDKAISQYDKAISQHDKAISERDKIEEVLKTSKSSFGQVVKLDMLTIIDRELADLKMISKDQFKLSPFVMAGPAFSKIQTAEIPAIPGSLNEPCWLLYGIGDGSTVSESRVERLKSRNVNDTVVLFAPSGAGKTRLCMELLWRHYGLFIGVKTGSDKNPGSTAMYDIARETEETLQRNPEKYEWASLLTDDRPSPLADTLRRDLAIFATNCVLAAYLAIFKALGGANSIDASDWLMVQMYPSHFLGKDRFAMLAKALFNECRELLNLELLRTADETGNRLNHLIVIDEANLLSKFCIERFVTMNESPTRSSLGRRSLISPILAATRSAMGRSPIISGTGLSLVEVYRSFETAISSVSTFERNCFSDFPRMSFEEVGALLGRVLNLTESERIRTSRWLEGRPRFTTDFLHLRLNHMRGTNGEATSFDETLKKYISLMTVGASRYNTVARTPRQALERLKEITQSQQSLEPDRNLRTTALLALFLIEYGVEDIILEDALGLVECGLAFPRPDRSEMKACVVPEPLLLEAGRQSRTEGFLNGQVTGAASSASRMANNFEYVVADRVIPLLVKRPFESNDMINVSIPAILKGGWSLAGSSYGRVGEYAGNDGERFYRWMDRVLDLEQWSSENPQWE